MYNQNSALDQYSVLEKNVVALSHKNVAWGDYAKIIGAKNGDGFCRGLTLMWAQAVFLDNVDHFNRRLSLLCTNNTYELIQNIQRHKDLNKRLGSLSANESAIITNTANQYLSANDLMYGELRAFMDGLTLHQRPENTSLKSCIPKQSILASSYVMPKELETLGNTGLPLPLTKLCNFPVFGNYSYCAQTLIDILRSAKSSLQNEPFVATLTMVSLDGPKDQAWHIIGLRIKGDNICVFDANFLNYNRTENGIAEREYTCQQFIEKFAIDCLSGFMQDRFFACSISILSRPTTKAVFLNMNSIRFKQQATIQASYYAKYRSLWLIVFCYGFVEELKLLASAYSRINDWYIKTDQNKHQRSPLHDCCSYGYNTDIVEVLLKATSWSPLYSIDNTRKNPVELACYYGYLDLVRLFLKSYEGLKSSDVETILYIAVQRCHIDIVRFMLNYENVLWRPSQLTRALQVAIKADTKNDKIAAEIIQLLLQHGALTNKDIFLKSSYSCVSTLLQSANSDRKGLLKNFLSQVAEAAHDMFGTKTNSFTSIYNQLEHMELSKLDVLSFLKQIISCCISSRLNNHTNSGKMALDLLNNSYHFFKELILISLPGSKIREVEKALIYEDLKTFSSL